MKNAMNVTNPALIAEPIDFRGAVLFFEHHLNPTLMALSDDFNGAIKVLSFNPLAAKI